MNCPKQKIDSNFHGMVTDFDDTSEDENRVEIRKMERRLLKRQES